MSTRATMIDPERQMLGEVEMVGQDRWEEIHRRAGAGASIRAIARELDVDRKTVRRCLRQTEWKPYQRAARADTLLATHAAYLRRRAADVGYSAQVLFQERRGRQYEGSYETVKRFVRPLREMQLYAAVTRTRFETPPGLQSQIDWGQARVWLGAQRQVRHIFVLTLGYSRRSVYVPCLTEALGDLLDAHEQAFTHFGGHTQEHLYDRPRTVCVPRGADGVRWNTTFKAFADFWGFEPRLCRVYRAQTKVQASYYAPSCTCDASFGYRRRSRNRFPGWATGSGPVGGSKSIVPLSSARTAHSTPSCANRLAVLRCTSSCTAICGTVSQPALVRCCK